MIDNENFTVLSNSAGMRVRLSRVGAAICQVHAPDKYGKLSNVALIGPSAEDAAYAGRTLAPFAGRIRKSILRMGEKTCALSPNEGENQLHGGRHNLSFALWEREKVTTESTNASVSFSARAPHGLDGFPGNRFFRVTYTLTGDNRLVIALFAESDRKTRVNMSNHAYWNLSGDFSRPMRGQFLKIRADTVYFNDAENLPSVRASVEKTVFDFRASVDPAARLQSGDAQLSIAGGYNHVFLLSAKSAPAATLFDPESGRRLRVFTDQPALVFYGGGYLPVPASALALEAEGLPDAPDIACPGEAVEPGKPYNRCIQYVFDVKNA